MTALPRIPLSVLDLMPIGTGSTPSGVLRATLDYARKAEELGFTRYWVAEHHNSANIASSSPPVTIAAIGAATSRIRVGSGGVMLPNHPPFVVAEQFATLNALYPDRVDLGVGRTPPHEPGVAKALRLDARGREAFDFPQQLGELFGFLRNDFPEGHALYGVSAQPVLTTKPSVWLLGSSENGARMAAELGLPFAFAHHFSPQNTVPAMQLYRRLFQPSEYLSHPYAILAAGATVAETDEQARRLTAPAAAALLWAQTGPPQPFPTPEEVEEHPWTPQERAWLDGFLRTQTSGSPETVRAKLADLLERSQAQELMAVSLITDPVERTRSLVRLRELFGSEPLPQGLA
ncbi:MAG TPA: LLM class flavin-dependent oxidoreductase [Thermomonospora sp.]|nr:LLM class flavin-dependent oxidoreductase [Thermomonospora sp.]